MLSDTQYLSKSNGRVLDAYNRGYRVINEIVYSPYREEPRVLQISNTGYYVFNVSRDPVPVHRLVAYQKYGNTIFEPGIEVRHRDSNKLNNQEDNILIGSHVDNMQDKSPKLRLKSSIAAATGIRRFTDFEIEEIRKFHKGSYKETMKTFDISSKGSLHYILNTQYQTKK